MSEGDAMDIETAKHYAWLFLGNILNVCEKAEVAGSIRRKKQQVHDIEIVVIPKYFTRVDVTLDGKETVYNLLHERMDVLLRNGIVTSDRQRKDKHRDPFGERYYRVNYNIDGRKIPVDLFSVFFPAQWGSQFLIRTGSAAFSKWIVSLRINQGLHFKDGHLEHDITGVIDTPTEESVFKALRLPYVPPERRELDAGGKALWDE